MHHIFMESLFILILIEYLHFLLLLDNHKHKPIKDIHHKVYCINCHNNRIIDQAVIFRVGLVLISPF